MRQHLWKIDQVSIDLEDRDAVVSFVHKLSLNEVTLRFRLKPEQIEAQALPLRRRLEILAGEIVLDLGAFLDSVPD
ncbi:hypothetical protein [Hyphomonas sp.]|uniref:hypothetical protein n=1 Tax=Hyphomonas sp. TaxID=87 RepID=UPI0039195728